VLCASSPSAGHGGRSAPTVQLAFSYVGTERSAEGGLLLVRRLRILTMRTASLAPTVDHLLASADPASVLCLVLHKVCVCVCPSPYAMTRCSLTRFTHR
jgi:hypothetical protein